MLKLLNKILEILYPKTCVFCGKVQKTQVCSACREKIRYIKEPRCKKCGKPIRYSDKELCTDCKENKHYYEQGKNIWLHKGPVRWSIYQFKYHNRRIYGCFYAEEMYRLYGQKMKEWGIERIIPVPLYKKRQKSRGYNQSTIVAKHLGKLAGIPVDTKSVVRIRNTKPQKELKGKERKQNVKDAFQLTKYHVTDENVLLIDDIYTTGNTIDAVAKVLTEKAGCKVFFFTISIGQGF